MQNLIQNPTFDQYADTYCKREWCISENLIGLNGQDASIAIAPWTVTSAGKDFEIVGNATWPGYGNSNWSMDLSGTEPYTIGQTVSTIPGASYSVSYFINENPCGPSAKTGFIQATGASQSTFSHSGKEWEQHLYEFVSNNDKVTLEIGSSTSDRWVFLCFF